MATKFQKPVVRVTESAYRVLYASADKARPIVVSLKLVSGEDMISFRAKGCREEWLLPVDAAFRQAVTRKAFQEKMAKGKDRAAKKRITARSRPRRRNLE